MISTFVNVTMYPLYNYNMLIKKKRKEKATSLMRSSLTSLYKHSFCFEHSLSPLPWFVIPQALIKDDKLYTCLFIVYPFPSTKVLDLESRVFFVVVHCYRLNMPGTQKVLNNYLWKNKWVNPGDYSLTIDYGRAAPCPHLAMELLYDHRQVG
jgi:hypothetical protein